MDRVPDGSVECERVSARPSERPTRPVAVGDVLTSAEELARAGFGEGSGERSPIRRRPAQRPLPATKRNIWGQVFPLNTHATAEAGRSTVPAPSRGPLGGLPAIPDGHEPSSVRTPLEVSNVAPARAIRRRTMARGLFAVVMVAATCLLAFAAWQGRDASPRAADRTVTTD